MEKNKKKTIWTAGICFVITAAIFLWFTFLDGMLGTFNWHIDIFTIWLVLMVTALFPAIFLIIGLIARKKAVYTVTSGLSIFSAAIWIIIFAGLNIVPYGKVDMEGLKLIKTQEPIPAAKRADGSLAHYAFSADPHWFSSASDVDARVKIIKNVDAGDYDAFFILGDISSAGILPSGYQEAVDELRANMKKTPLLAIPGNHDGIVGSIPVFYKRFLPDAKNKYFRMDNGKIHMIFIYMLWDDAEFSKSQEKWLIKQLEEIPQEDTVIVLSHCYITGSGYWDDVAQKNWGDIPNVVNRLCPILEKYNVDLSLSGHDHFFEILKKDDVDYVVLGSMGGVLDTDLVYSSPYSKWLNNTDFGWVDMKVFDSYMQLKFISSEGKELTELRVNTK